MQTSELRIILGVVLGVCGLAAAILATIALRLRRRRSTPVSSKAGQRENENSEGPSLAKDSTSTLAEQTVDLEADGATLPPSTTPWSSSSAANLLPPPQALDLVPPGSPVLNSIERSTLQSTPLHYQHAESGITAEAALEGVYTPRFSSPSAWTATSEQYMPRSQSMSSIIRSDGSYIPPSLRPSSIPTHGGSAAPCAPCASPLHRTQFGHVCAPSRPFHRQTRSEGLIFPSDRDRNFGTVEDEAFQMPRLRASTQPALTSEPLDGTGQTQKRKRMKSARARLT